MSDANKIVELFYSPDSSNIALALILAKGQGVDLECLYSLERVEAMDEDDLEERLLALFGCKHFVVMKFTAAYVWKASQRIMAYHKSLGVDLGTHHSEFSLCKLVLNTKGVFPADMSGLVMSQVSSGSDLYRLCHLIIDLLAHFAGEGEYS